MNHRLSLLEYLVTLALVIIALSLCYQWLSSELVSIVELSFSKLPT